MIDPGKLDTRISVMGYRNGAWEELGTLWGSAEYSARVIYASVAAATRGYKITVRKSALIRLDRALRVNGDHCLIASVVRHKQYDEIEAAAVTLQRCTLRRKNEDVGQFEAVLAEQYVNWTQATPNAKHETGMLLITPKEIVLRPGDIVAVDSVRYSVRACHMAEGTHNAYEIRTGVDA